MGCLGHNHPRGTVFPASSRNMLLCYMWNDIQHYMPAGLCLHQTSVCACTSMHGHMCVYTQLSFLRSHPFWFLIGSVTGLETDEEARPQESVCLCLPVLKVLPCPAYSWILGVEFRSSCFYGKHFIDSTISSGLKRIYLFLT